MRPLIACALLLVTALHAELGMAADDPRDAASADYARGMELVKQGLYEAALEQFNAAYAKSPHFAVLYNIGQAQIALGRPLEAIASLASYLREGADKVPLSRREQVQAQIGLLESRLAELSVTTNRQGAVVRVDGRDVGRTPLFQPIRLAAGPHTVTASLPDGAQITRELSLREAERQTLELAFTAALPQAAAVGSISEKPPAAAPPPDLLRTAAPAKPTEPWYFQGKTMRRTAYVVAGLGVLSAGAALGVYLANRGKYDEWKTGNAALQSDTKGSAAYRAQATSDNALAGSLGNANKAIVGLSIAGGVLAAAGVTLFIVDRAHRREAGQLSFGVGDRSANLAWGWTW